MKECLGNELWVQQPPSHWDLYINTNVPMYKIFAKEIGLDICKSTENRKKVQLGNKQWI